MQADDSTRPNNAICSHCQTPFRTYPSELLSGKGRFCSRRCARAYEKLLSNTPERIAKRFWPKVDKDGPIHPALGTPCWIWTASRDPSSYGRFTVNAVPQLAHRVSYELAYGPLPVGQLALHKCDNPPCVNPTHLFAGTNQDNMDDMYSKGRQASGERHGLARLSDESAEAVRVRYADGGVTYGQLAAEYGVSKDVIGYAVRRGKRGSA